MAKVNFPDSFLSFSGGIREYETHVTIYRDLELELKEKFPDITLGEACEALNLEGYTDYVGMLKSTIDESNSA